MYLFIVKLFTVLILKYQIINNREPCTKIFVAILFYFIDESRIKPGKKDADEIAVEMVGELTTFEKELLKRQGVIEIRGNVCLSLF